MEHKSNEGMPFSVSDLAYALTWAEKTKNVSVEIAVDHPTVPEAIEVFHHVNEREKKARWCLWIDDKGVLHLDDWKYNAFDLPYYNVADALFYIQSII